MSVILTKDGNTIRITTKDNKVVWFSIEDFLSAFTLDKLTMTVSFNTPKIVIKDHPIGDLDIAGNSSLSTIADLGNAIKDLCEIDTDGGSFAYTPEDVSNKSTNVTTDSASDVKYPSVKAVKTYADTKQAAIGYTTENVANKDTDSSFAANSDTRYPSQKAVKTRFDALPVLASGTWTPTLTNNSNVDASTSGTCSYLRVGSVVNIAGEVYIDPAATGQCVLYLTLPISSTSPSCRGVVCQQYPNTADVVGFLADSGTASKICIIINPISRTNNGYIFTGQYQIN